MQAQAIVCDNQVNVSLSENCDAVITADLILEGTLDPAIVYTLDIEGVVGTTVTAPGIYRVTVTEANNNNNSCWGLILVEDKLPPVITCPCDPNNPIPGEDCALPILCEDFGDIGGLVVAEPTISDNCLSADDFDLTFVDEVNGQDCSASIVTRRWTFSNAQGDTYSCVSRYSIEPISVGNIITPPNNSVLLECGVGNSPEEVFQFVFDNFPPCLLPSCLDPDDAMHDDAIEAYDRERTAAANRAAFPTINGMPLNGVICNTLTSFSDTVLPICSSEPGCDGNVKVVREWSIFDWCNPLTPPLRFSQVVEAADNTPPSIDAEGFTRSVDPWGCTTRVVFPSPTKLSDNCTANVSYVVTGSGSTDAFDVVFDPAIGFYVEDLPVGQHTFFYNAFDCCDNTSSQGVVVTVVDATPPVAVTKQDIVVSLIPNPSNQFEPGLTKIFASNIDNGSFDGCGPVKLEIRRDSNACGAIGNATYNNDGHPNDDDDDPDNGEFVTFCCQDLDDFGVDPDGDGINDYAQIRVWLRVFDDGDGDGVFGSEGDNFSEVWSFVRLEDKSRPAILCPSNVVIQCDSDADDLSLTGEATAASACAPNAVTFTDEVDLTNCRVGTITRTFSVVDNPSVSCEQTITLQGDINSDPIEVFFPADTIITCTEELLDIRPYWTSNGACDQLAFSVDRDTFFFSDGACFKILNYFTVIDWCTYDPNVVDSDGIFSDVQVVKVIDNDAPELLNCDDVVVPVTENCENDNVMLTNSAVDAGVCASSRLSWNVQVDINSDWVIDYTFSSSAPRTSEFFIAPTASGEEVKITLPEEVSGSMINHRVIWRVSDGCGNNTSCTSSFMVLDQKPPTPYCLNLSTALMVHGQVTLWACDFDLGAEDNCTAQEDLRFTFSDVPPANDPSFDDDTNCSSRIFTCDDIINPAGTVVPIEVYVWDEKGNADFCVVFLTLVDNQEICDVVDIGARPTAAIGGNVQTELGEDIENVMIELVSPQPSYPASQMTSDEGEFMFERNPFDYDYQVSGHKNDDVLNGVSTLDLVVIQRHILQSSQLDSPYKLIAADINNDELITAIDLIELRKVILGVHDEFPNNTSWKLVDNSTIVDPLHPWSASQERLIPSLGTNRMQEDFIGVKIGDVNGSVMPNVASQSVDSRSSVSLDLSYNDVSYVAGDRVEMIIKSDEITDLLGLQFTFKSYGLELVDVLSNGLDVDDSNFAVLNSETITFSWNSNNTVSESELFTFVFNATASGTLSNNVAISSEVTSAEAYSDLDGSIIPVKLAGRNNPEQDYSLLQNNPNPFSRTTTIDFVLPQTANATLSVMDVNGRLLWSVDREFNKGYNSIELSNDQLDASGILYYRLESGDYSATKKMVKIN